MKLTDLPTAGTLTNAIGLRDNLVKAISALEVYKDRTGQAAESGPKLVALLEAALEAARKVAE